MQLNYQRARHVGDFLIGNIPILDVQYGNVWTNINDSLFRTLGVKTGDSLMVSISKTDSVYMKGIMPFVATFGEVGDRQPLAYLNSLLNLSFALNMASFADSFNVQSGPEWNITVRKHILGK